jgi:hypothetical protein
MSDELQSTIRVQLVLPIVYCPICGTQLLPHTWYQVIADGTDICLFCTLTQADGTTRPLDQADFSMRATEVRLAEVGPATAVSLVPTATSSHSDEAAVKAPAGYRVGQRVQSRPWRHLGTVRRVLRHGGRRPVTYSVQWDGCSVNDEVAADAIVPVTTPSDTGE